jgi:hypothetical protein
MAQSIPPGLANSRSNQVAIAGADLPIEGLYTDRDWSVGLRYSDGTYKYYGTNNHDESHIELSGAVVSGTKRRRIYTWNNSGTRYRVIRQTNDHQGIRLQPTSSRLDRKKVILDKVDLKYQK